ncbi:MAG: ATP-grasp domain-containing protein, partial [Chloroflexota bacterium]
VLGVLEAVTAVRRALEALRYEVTTLPIRPPLSPEQTELDGLAADVVFNLFEGFDGMPESEALIAGLLEERGVCFTGSPRSALLLCQDKNAEKQLLRSRGIPTPKWQVLSPDNLSSFALNLPCIVKPIGEHASHGLSEHSVTADSRALEKQVNLISRTYGRASLVEEFLPGREFSILVVGNENPRILPVEEILYTLPMGKARILTYEAKWVPDHEYFMETKAKCPAELDAELRQQIERCAVRCFAVIGCQGYARLDMRLDSHGKPMVLDVNPNPDISSQGGARLQVEAAGIEYPDFIAEVLSLAQARHQKPCGKEERGCPTMEKV